MLTQKVQKSIGSSRRIYQKSANICSFFFHGWRIWTTPDTFWQIIRRLHWGRINLDANEKTCHQFYLYLYQFMKILFRTPEKIVREPGSWKKKFYVGLWYKAWEFNSLISSKGCRRTRGKSHRSQRNGNVLVQNHYPNATLRPKSLCHHWVLSESCLKSN